VLIRGIVDSGADRTVLPLAEPPVYSLEAA
jgi:hypothetical protein